MTSTEVTAVLKFGSSVLASHTGLQRAVEEVYRLRREGAKIIAVVSALGESTDLLIAEARRIAPDPSPHALAVLLATGESKSVALLTMACLRSGITACPVASHEIDLLTTSDSLDASPISVGSEKIGALLVENDVLVVPGFVGHDGFGRTTLLGRGGSDLTAVFLAQAIGAKKCRLLKDTEGVFEWDPDGPGPRPRSFTNLHYADAKSLGGIILQKKAIALAEARKQSIEVAKPASNFCTVIGSRPSTQRVATPTSGPDRISVLGCGQVGRAVVRRLCQEPGRFEVVGVAVRSKKRPRQGVPEALLATNAIELVQKPAEIVVELMGGITPARACVADALRLGKDVVTANKELIALHGEELAAIARTHGRILKFSAAVGGSLPLLETLALSSGLTQVVAIEGILNGTTNFILDRLHRHGSLKDAVARAQSRGLCEQDPQEDLAGIDAERKLTIIARACGAESIESQVQEMDLGEIECLCRAAAARGRVIRQVADLRLEKGRARGRVILEDLSSNSFLGQTTGAENRVVISYDDNSTVNLQGIGAGPQPTAESILGDVLEIRRIRSQESGTGNLLEDAS